MTAKRPPADTNTAHDLRLIPDADLPQFNPGLEHTGQILHQFPEINATVRRKIKQNLIVVKGILRINELHIQLMLFDLFKAYAEGILFLYFVICLLLMVSLVGNPDHRLQRLDYLFIFNLRNPGHHGSEFYSSCRLNDHMIAPLYFKIQRIKKINLPRRSESYANYSRHLSTSRALLHASTQYSCTLPARSISI